MNLKVNGKRIAKVLGIMLFVCWLAIYAFLRGPSFMLATELPEAIRAEPARLEKHVRSLTEIEPTRSFEVPPSMFKAEAYIREQLEKLGFTVRLQPVSAPGGVTFNNVIARYGTSTSSQLVVVGAHYDVAGVTNPGADDNASGVAGLLELARMLQENKPVLALPVELVFYTLEEPPFFGSRDMGSAYHADSLKEAGIDVVLMISLEMLGYFSDELFSQKFPMPLLYAFYPWRGDFIGVVGAPGDRDLISRVRVQMSANSGVPVYSIAAPSTVVGVDFSDHRNYWTHNWPAVMVTDTAFFRNDAYHTPRDTPDRLDYVKMAEVVRGVFAAVTSIAN